MARLRYEARQMILAYMFYTSAAQIVIDIIYLLTR